MCEECLTLKKKKKTNATAFLGLGFKSTQTAALKSISSQVNG